MLGVATTSHLAPSHRAARGSDPGVEPTAHASSEESAETPRNPDLPGLETRSHSPRLFASAGVGTNISPTIASDSGTTERLNLIRTLRAARIARVIPVVSLE